jgi:hypothetical protein
VGFLNSIKSKFGGNKTQIKQGVDKAAEVVAPKAGDHADKVNQGAAVVKDAIDKIPG